MPNSYKNKTILHMDGDAFFVGVEIAKNPKLKGLPVVTGEEKGIVTALSYEAKALGIERGAPIFRIKRDYPKVIILPGDYGSYARYSTMMFDIVRRYADEVEEYSIDECFADLTGLDWPLKMSYREIAQKIKEEINKELKLSVSIGLGSTKVLAKLASKWKKPDGLTIIEKEKVNDFLKETPIGKIWGIGWRTEASLVKMGIKTAEDFVNKKLEWIKENLSKPYEIIWHELQGLSILEIDAEPKKEYKSMQRTRSFHPATSDKLFLFSQLSKHIEDVCAKARHYELGARRFSIFLKSREFKYFTLEFDLPYPTNTPEILIGLARGGIEKIYNKNILYRTTGVNLYGLMPEDVSQDDLFGNNSKIKKFEIIHKQIDKLENKYGRKVVYLASTHFARQRKEKGTDMEDLDRDLLFL